MEVIVHQYTFAFENNKRKESQLIHLVLTVTSSLQGISFLTHLNYTLSLNLGVGPHN